MTSESQPRPLVLIRNRLSATIAVLATGIVTFDVIREVVLNPTKRVDWLLSPFLSLPLWVTVAANVVFYLFALWIGVLWFWGTKGKERVVAGGWLLGWILLSVESFWPAVSIIRYIDAITWGIAFLAALAVFLEFYTPRDTRVETSADDR
jgi:hypothetical protein